MILHPSHYAGNQQPQSETTTTAEDSDIDITEDKTSKEDTPESPEVALPPTPRPPSPETTYTLRLPKTNPPMLLSIALSKSSKNKIVSLPKLSKYNLS